jgi:hypothetical protein
MITQIYTFPTVTCATNFLEDLKTKGFEIQSSTITPSNGDIWVSIKVGFQKPNFLLTFLKSPLTFFLKRVFLNHKGLFPKKPKGAINGSILLFKV